MFPKHALEKWRRAKWKLRWGLYYAARIGALVAGINFISIPAFVHTVHTTEISTGESSNWENTVGTEVSFIALFLMDEKTRRACRYRGFPT